MKYILLILVLLQQILAQTSTQVCSSSCAAHTSPCKNFNYNGCIACDRNIYNDISGAMGCIPKPQVNIEAVDLQNPIDFSSFDVTSRSSYSCNGFEIGGKFGNTDTISKTYYVSNPHHKMIVKFSIIYIGTLSTNDQIFLWIDGIKYSFNYGCEVWTSLCGAKQCLRFISQDIQHSQSKLQIAINGSISAGASWGIKDLIVASYGCHPSCSSCYGGEYSQCLFCADGYYLEGNVCVTKCSNFSMQQSKFCVNLCPNGHYPNASNYCSDCYKGCQFCTGPTLNQCLMAQVAGPAFYKNIGLNIFIIVFCLLIVSFAIYWWIKRCQRKSQLQVSDSHGQLGKRIVHQTSQNFIQDNSFNHSSLQKSRDVLMNEKDDYRMRKVSVLQEIQL